MRSRNVKPGFFKDGDLSLCDFAGRLLFLGLSCLADRDGRLKDDPRQIKAEVFPHDSVDMDHLLGILAQHRLVARYEVDGRRYIQVSKDSDTFQKHARPHKDEVCEGFPPPPKNCPETPRNFPTSCALPLTPALTPAPALTPVCPAEPGTAAEKFPDPGTPDTSPAKAKRDKARSAKEAKPREPDPLFDAVAEVTSSDPKVSGSHIGRICKALRSADPPYTPDEVRHFPAAMAKTHSWFTGPATLGTIEKYVGILRVKQTKGAVVTPDDLAHGTFDGINPFQPNTKTCKNPDCQRKQCVAARKGGEG